MERLDTPALAALLCRVLINGSECGGVLARRLPPADAARVREAVRLLDAAAGETVGVLERLADGESAGPMVH